MATAGRCHLHQINGADHSAAQSLEARPASRCLEHTEPVSGSLKLRVWKASSKSSVATSIPRHGESVWRCNVLSVRALALENTTRPRIATSPLTLLRRRSLMSRLLRDPSGFVLTERATLLAVA